jgi:hypothetical protein
MEFLDMTKMISRRPIRNGLAGKVFILSLAAGLGGCSATSLRCGVDNDSSFVELYNVPQNFSQNIRSYSELCGFAYEPGQVARLEIVDNPQVLARRD